MDKFEIRSDKSNEIQDLIDNCNHSSVCINIYGNSGTGKTFLVQEALTKFFDSNIKATVIYINLVDDLLSTTAFWDIFLFTVWNGNINDKKSMLRVDTQCSLSKYLHKKFRGKMLANILFRSITSIVATIPYYNAQLEVGGLDVPKNDTLVEKDPVLEKSQILIAYLKYVAKKGNLIIILDNYQFMNISIRHYFESSINQIKKNVAFLNIQRIDRDNYQQPISFQSRSYEIETYNLSLDDTLELILKKKFPNLSILNDVAEDCYAKTKGNLKEIDLYLRANEEDIKKGILKKNKTRDLSAALNDLSQLQRELILLAALFPSGLKLQYVVNLLKRIFTFDQTALDSELQNIITLGYVMLNSSKNDLLKPAHDKICLSLETVNSTEDFLEIYNDIKNGLEEIIHEKCQSSDYIYLLHCYIGICDSKKLLNSLNYLEELIFLKYENCDFLYLVELANEYVETEEKIIIHLSNECILILLDACQKTCSFKTSLSILEIVNQKSVQQNCFLLYHAKVMTQSYEFEAALNELKQLPKTNETLLYKLIVFEHLGMDHDAHNLLLELMDDLNVVYDKWYYIILRNTAHYFTYEQAKEHLLKSQDYFNKCGTIFEQATIFNNLSVIQIWNGKETYKEAEKNIKNAINKFLEIGSNEIFEAYYNYGVLWYMKGNYRNAQKYYNLALDYVPRNLSMDVALLQLNQKICECTTNHRKIADLEKYILKCINQSEILQDPWVRFQLEYNLMNLEVYSRGNTNIHPSEAFLPENNDKNTALTVFTHINIDSKKLPICLSLSPNWRY